MRILIKTLSFLIAALISVNPFTFAQASETTPSQKAEDNAAVYYEKAFTLLKEYSVEETEEWEIVIKNGRKEENQKLENILRENKPALQEIKKGLNLEKCDFNMGKNFVYLLDRPNPPRMKAYLTAYLLMLDGYFSEKMGDSREALEKYLSALTFAQHISQRNMLLDFLVSGAVAESAYSVLGYKLANTKVNKENCWRILDFLKEIRPRMGSIETAMEDEKKTAISELKRIVDKHIKKALEKERIVKIGEDMAGIYYAKLAKAVRTNSPEEWADYEQKVKLLRKENIGALSPLKFNAAVMMNKIIGNSEEKLEITARKLSGIILAVCLPDKERAEKWYFLEARPEMIKLLAAIILYHFDKNKVPEIASEVVPEYLSEIPMDAYSQQALKYKKTENGFVIYSVGNDKQDNGGEGGFEKDEAGKDIVLTVDVSQWGTQEKNN